MGLLDYIEDEQPLFGGVLRDGYNASSVSQGGSSDDIVSRYQPPVPTEASPASLPSSGLPRVPIWKNSLPVVEVTADQSPPTANQESSLLGVLESLGVGAANTGIGLVSAPHEWFGVENAPSAQEVQEWLETKLRSKLHKPTGRAEEIAETIGGFLPGLIVGGVPGLVTRLWAGAGARALAGVGARYLVREGATGVLAPAIASEAAAQYYKGTDKERLARIAGAFGGASTAGFAQARLAGVKMGIARALLANLGRSGLRGLTANGEDAAKHRREAK